ncbi:hypothetical protein GVN16_23610, partial [Emticicia sp. CRIBPO]|nr:hypothetical protein [Emticicia sp. CRIBPO]
MIKSSDALTEQETMKPGGGISFLRGFEKLTLKKELNTVNLSYPDEFGNQKPIYSRPIFPVGTDSWCWAPLGKKYVAAQNVPVQFFNVAIDGSSITNWQAGTPNYNRLLNLLKRQANIVGHRGILWHQGEADASQSMSESTYQSYLKSMVDNIQSAFDPSGSTWGPLTWNISKVSYHTKYNPPNFDVFDNSTVNPNFGIRNAQSNVSFASSIKKTGIDTDGILPPGRGPFQKIHFHGATHNTVGEMWKNAGLWNNTPKEAMGAIARLTYEKLSNGNIRLKVVQDYPIAEFKWVKNEDGIEDNVGSTDTYDVPGFSSAKVFYTCFVRPTGKNYYLITAPFIGPNEVDKNPRIEIVGSTNQINLSGSQQTKVAEIYSQNMTWTSTITGGSGWLSIIENPSGSFGSTNVKIQTLTNSGSNVRNATITFNGVGPLGETMSKSLVISQSGSASGTVSLLTLSPSSGSFNTNVSNDMNTMQIGGVQYFQGLGVHAPNTVTYNLSGQYSTFFGKVGRDDEADNAYDSGKVQFVIKADGTVIWTSQVHGNNTSAEAFNVNVSGKNNLELIVNQLEDMNFDHADWVDLYLTTSGGGGCSTPTNPSNVLASASSITSGQSTTLSASCSVGTITWSTGQTGASVSVSPTVSTTYQVSCVNGACQSGTVPVSITVNPSGGGGACSAISNNLTMGTWTVTGQPLVARYFHGQYWLTQKVSSSPDEFVVRGAAMLQRSDVSLNNSSYY